MSNSPHPQLKGNTDGKTIGTYVENKFKAQIQKKYQVALGSSVSGIDLPSTSIHTDIKVTSANNPQSSSPFKNARQKIFGLGHNILLFVYEKNDKKKNNMTILNCVFIDKSRTADYQITRQIINLLKNDANSDDIAALLSDSNLPVDDIQLDAIVSEILKNPPIQGYLAISNALQWRLRYSRVAAMNENQASGVEKIYDHEG